MFIERSISLLMSAVIFVNSVMFYHPVPKYEEPEIVETVTVDASVESIEEVIELPVEEVQPIVEDIEPIIEPEIESEPEPEIPEVPEIEVATLSLSDSDIDLIALVTMAEAEGECEEGKRLVIDVILNRYDSSRFPNTISGVIYAKNAFECMWNGRVNRCYVRDDIRQLVIEELQSRTNSNIHYFRTNYYHKFGKPVVSVGNHYFSTY